ncbi:hypothetical protein J7I97_16625 [Streptomyces sp. ISL-87]|uniref:hypothetical protein n=1 Tax=Streptomyces sp. ISL-87 TaxID=2819188 RepID=UPI001BE95081|nr:hypothetical protein [Streptomyces sp. ISL-87]MBT2609859.1 hypothetical protein [Streptomyces sp. ISL-87]
MSKGKQSEAQRGFLRDLNDTVRRYGLFVESAGCCGELLLLGGKAPLDIRYDYDEEVYRAF